MSLRTFSYTAELEKAAQNSKWNDCLSQVSTEQPQIFDSEINVNLFELGHTLTSLLEFEESLYYFLLSDSTREGKEKEFALTISSFKKKNGENYKTSISNLKGTPSAVATTFLCVDGLKGCRAADKEEEKLRIVMLVGLQEGFIKVVELVEHRSSVRAMVDSHKVEQKPVISVVAAEPRHYNHRNICFLLLEDSKIFLYNFLSKQVVAIFQPPILSHDFAICLTLHVSGLNIASASKSGQIFFWELGKPVLEAIERSENHVKRRADPSGDQEVQEVEWEFSAKDRAINVFPMTALHAASIHGLKWISFYGDLLAMVSRRGLFRLIAVNFPLRDEYLNLIEYQIQEGEAISSVQIFPQLEVVVVTKCREYTALLSEEESRARASSSGSERRAGGDYNARLNGNCYGIKTITECVMEKVKFGSDLRVENVVRVRMADKKSKPRRLVDFTYSIVSQNCNFLLVGNSQQYCIAPCDELFGVER